MLLLLVTVADMITALGLVVDVQAISRNINADVVVSLHWLEMLLLLLLPIVVGQMTTLLRLIYHHLLVGQWLQLLPLLGVAADATSI
jgi:hypothetical protein